MNTFRDHSPKRTCSKVYKNYRDYKPYLAADFANRCGYTNCPDTWFGGIDNFHIDHFVPWKKYPELPNLETDYSNLVYSCSYVNISKSNDEGQYLDPCDEDYNKHFFRDTYGNIIPHAQSAKAVYMHKKLKLYLKRYQIIWMLDKLEAKLQELSELRQSKTLTDKVSNKINAMIADLVQEYFQYRKYLISV